MNSNINSLDLPVEKMDKLFEQLSSATSKKAKEQIAKDISAKTGHQFSIANRYFLCLMIRGDSSTAYQSAKNVCCGSIGHE
jgi:hypothetical protein